jgi:GLPGLI family protein
MNMKQMTRIMLVVAIFALALSGSATAKDFKGIITYKISYSGTDLDEQTKAMLPKMMIYKIRGNMGRTEMDLGAMGKQVQIINGDEKVVYSLMDMMGQKMVIKMTEEELMEEAGKQPEFTIEQYDETKEIAGYECKKAVINFETDDGSKNSFIVYYTEELGGKALNFDNPMFKDINGVLMEFEMEQGPMKMKLEAVSVKKENVPDSEFVVPEGYKELTREEMQNMFGGGM